MHDYYLLIVTSTWNEWWRTVFIMFIFDKLSIWSALFWFIKSALKSIKLKIKKHLKSMYFYIVRENPDCKFWFCHSASDFTYFVNKTNQAENLTVRMHFINDENSSLKYLLIALIMTNSKNTANNLLAPQCT